MVELLGVTLLVFKHVRFREVDRFSSSKTKNALIFYTFLVCPALQRSVRDLVFLFLLVKHVLRHVC